MQRKAIDVAIRRKQSLERRAQAVNEGLALEPNRPSLKIRESVLRQKAGELDALIFFAFPPARTDGADLDRYRSPRTAGEWWREHAARLKREESDRRFATCYGCGEPTHGSGYRVDDIRGTEHGFCGKCQAVWSRSSYSVKPAQIRALSPEARVWFRATEANIRASDRRMVKRIPTLAQLNPVIRKRERDFSAWANAVDWRAAKKAAIAPVKVPSPRRMASVTTLERKIQRLHAQLERLAA